MFFVSAIAYPVAWAMIPIGILRNVFGPKRENVCAFRQMVRQWNFILATPFELFLFAVINTA